MGLGAIVRQQRERLGMTQDVLAAKAGISKPYLSNIETGRAKNPPSDTKVVALEVALHLDRGTLLDLAHLARTPPDVRADHERLQVELEQLRSVLKGLMTGPRKANGGLDLDALAARLRAQEPLESGNVRTIRIGATVPIINKVAAGYPQNFTDLDYPAGVADEYLRCPDLNDPQAFAAHVVGDSMEPEYHEGDIVVFSPNTPARNTDDCFVRFEADNSTTFKRFYLDGEAIRLQPLNNRYPAQTFQRQQLSGLWPAVFRFERLRR